METSQNYRGFGITYQPFDGTTTVHDMGFLMKVFRGYGEISGEKAAKVWIDDYWDMNPTNTEDYVDDDDFFDFGEDRAVSKQTVIDRKHTYMLSYFDAIGKQVQFGDTRIGILVEVGEDDHDYWLRVSYGDKDILESPLTKWKIVEQTDL